MRPAVFTAFPACHVLLGHHCGSAVLQQQKIIARQTRQIIFLSECMTNPQESYPDMLNRLSQERSALLALEDDQPEFYKADPLLQQRAEAVDDQLQNLHEIVAQERQRMIRTAVRQHLRRKTPLKKIVHLRQTFRPGTTFTDAHSIAHKIRSIAMVVPTKRFSYVFEQSGETVEDMGKNFHMHTSRAKLKMCTKQTLPRRSHARRSMSHKRHSVSCTTTAMHCCRTSRGASLTKNSKGVQLISNGARVKVFSRYTTSSAQSPSCFLC